MSSADADRMPSPGIHACFVSPARRMAPPERFAADPCLRDDRGSCKRHRVTPVCPCGFRAHARSELHSCRDRSAEHRATRAARSRRARADLASVYVRRCLGNRVQSGMRVLRQTFCSHLAVGGARSIQELAGNRDVTTTTRHAREPRARSPGRFGCSNGWGVSSEWRPAGDGSTSDPEVVKRVEVVGDPGFRQLDPHRSVVKAARRVAQVGVTAGGDAS